MDASEKTYISVSKFERIEYGTVEPTAEDLLIMADAYNAPFLYNYYLSNVCMIGKQYKPIADVNLSVLPKYTLNMLSIINALNKSRESLIDITADGVISDDEMEDFEEIQDNLNKMMLAIKSLNLWIEKVKADNQ